MVRVEATSAVAAGAGEGTAGAGEGSAAGGAAGTTGAGEAGFGVEVEAAGAALGCQNIRQFIGLSTDIC